MKRVGAILHAGTVVANLDLDDPSKVKKAQKTDQTLPQYNNQTGRGDKVHQVSVFIERQKYSISYFGASSGVPVISPVPKVLNGGFWNR